MDKKVYADKLMTAGIIIIYKGYWPLILLEDGRIVCQHVDLVMFSSS